MLAVLARETKNGIGSRWVSTFEPRLLDGTSLFRGLIVVHIVQTKGAPLRGLEEVILHSILLPCR
jgi:hypothetical protein